MRRLRFFFCLLTAALVAIGCGDTEDGDGEETPTYPELEESPPLDLATVDLGVGLRHGSPQAIGFLDPGTYPEVVQTVPHAVLRVQSYDEIAQKFGGYITYPFHEQPSPRPPTDFFGQNTSNGDLAARVADLVEETNDAAQNAGTENFETISVMVDFFRTREDWYVRWDGKLDTEANTVGTGDYGFYREDMSSDLLDEIEEVATQQEPRYFIIGAEMGRLLQREQGSGLSPAEWSNFLLFYQEAIQRIRTASPQTRVGVGINWDRFFEDIAPNYAEPGDRPLQALDRAFETVLLPVLERSDVITLSSYREPDEASVPLGEGELSVQQAYQFLRRLQDLYELDKPVVWYSIGSPVEASVSYQAQRRYLEDFLNWNAGVNVEFVAWRALMNVDGADASGQTLTGRCAALVEGNNNTFEMPVRHCFDGLFDSVFQPKPAYQLIRESLE